MLDAPSRLLVVCLCKQYFYYYTNDKSKLIARDFLSLRGFFFFLDNVYSRTKSGTAQSTRQVTAHRHICKVEVGTYLEQVCKHGRWVAPSQRGRRSPKEIGQLLPVLKTSNTSSPGLSGIGYQLIKWA
jgi:hypothetical protein